MKPASEKAQELRDKLAERNALSHLNGVRDI